MEKHRLSKCGVKSFLACVMMGLALGACHSSNRNHSNDIFGSSSEEYEETSFEDMVEHANEEQASTKPEKRTGKAHIELQDSLIDMGSVNKTKAPDATCEVVFKNTGDGDLVIQDVEAYCECTKVDFPKSPIEPGDRGVVKVHFNARLVNGSSFHKYLQILSNADNGPQPVTIQGKLIY